MEKLNELMSKACLASEMGKKGITVDLQMLSQIRDEFWAVEKRAEAAEAKLEVEKDIHDDTVQAMHLWCERAKESEAKLAELEKQEPIAHAWDVPKYPGSDKKITELCSPKHKDAYPVYSRPAPAINLSELVPEQVSIRQAIAALENHEYCTTPASGYKAGVKDTIAAILRKIEGAG